MIPPSTQFDRHRERIRQMQLLREASTAYFDDGVRQGDLFVIHNDNVAHLHFVVYVGPALDIHAFTHDRIIKAFSFSRNCLIQFFRGPAQQSVWSGSFSSFDISRSYNYANLPLEIKKIAGECK